MGQRIGYRRVSSIVQSTERQLEGVTLDRMYEDKLSGKDVNRPQLKAAMDYCRDGDTLIVHSLDRLARNTEDLLRIVRELNAKGVSVEFVKNHMAFAAASPTSAWKGDAPMAKLMLTMLAAFAEFERNLIRERQAEGIAIARTKGVYKGGQPKLTPVQAKELRSQPRKGVPNAELARKYGVSRETVYQYQRSGHLASA
jgi:DNA invertase Pin-like site-specific DNA recombinase